MLGVIATVQLGNGPISLAVSPDGTRVYVAHATNHTISVIDTATNTVTATFSAGHHLRRAAVSPDGARLYVTNANASANGGPSGGLTIIDTATHAATSMTLAGEPYGVAVSSDSSRVYVTNKDTPGSVYVIDAASNTVTATIGTVDVPDKMAVSPDGTRLYVNHAAVGGLSVIDTATHAVTYIPIGSNANSVAVSPDGTRVYVTDAPPPCRVHVIDAATNTVIATIPSVCPPGHLAVDPDNALVYLAQFSENQTVDVGHVVVIDPATNTVSDAIPVGLEPTSLTVHPDGSRIYVINALDGTVSVIGRVFTLPPGKLPDLVGKVFGGAAAGGGGWLVIGNHFYKIPPRSPLLLRIAQVAAPHLGKPIENRKLGEQLRKTL